LSCRLFFRDDPFRHFRIGGVEDRKIIGGVLFDFAKAPGVAFVPGIGRLQPGIDNCVEFVGGDVIAAGDQDVGGVVATAQVRLFDGINDGCAHVGKTVGVDAHARACAADENAAVAFAVGDALCQHAGVVGIVVRWIVLVRAEVFVVDAVCSQVLSELLLEFEAAVVSCNQNGEWLSDKIFD